VVYHAHHLAVPDKAVRGSGDLAYACGIGFCAGTPEALAEFRGEKLRQAEAGQVRKLNFARVFREQVFQRGKAHRVYHYQQAGLLSMFHGASVPKVVIYCNKFG
jgi:hypothetical protein